MGKRTNIAFIALLTFLVALRLGLLGGDESSAVPSRLVLAADWLIDYYRDSSARPGWRPGWQVADVQAEEKSVAVRVQIAASERRALTAAPEALQSAGLANLCPVYNHRVWDMFSGGQHIRIDGVDDAGQVFLSHRCPRRGV